MLHGTVRRLVPAHGFGFIVDDAGLDWFFITDDLRGGTFAEFKVDERVGFSSQWTPRGPRAMDVHHEQHD